MKKALVLLMSLTLVLFTAACGGGSSTTTTGSGEGSTAASGGSNSSANTKAAESKPATNKSKLTIAWLPNESGADLGSARDEIGKIVEEATGLKVEHKVTTDYIIAVEAVANGNADLGFFGPQGYIEAHDKNSNVLPLVVPSGKKGTLDDAVYYGWLAVKLGNEGEYKNGDSFSIDNIAGKRFSFVSTSSTSGFKVPSSGIVSHFGKMDPYKELKADDLLEGGANKFFSEVLYGNSHQGSAMNLITGKVDVAAFCDTCVANYVELVSGEASRPGAVYKVKEGAEDPFGSVVGEQFILIAVTPVLNSPIVANVETIGQEAFNKIQTMLASDEMANNPKIFVPDGSDFLGIFKKTGDERFLPVEDAWFNPIRELSK